MSIQLPERVPGAAGFDPQTLDALPVAVVVVDGDWRITGWNLGAERLYGWPAAEAIGRNVVDALVLGSDAELAANILDRLRAGASWRGRFELRAADGSTVSADTVVAPIPGEDGEVSGAVAILVERPERTLSRRASSAVERLDDLRTIADSALSHLDLDGLLEELLARVRARLQGDSATILLLTEDGTHLRVRASLGRSGRVIERLRIPIGRGISGRIAASAVPLLFPDIAGEEVIGQDLRERMRSIAGAPMIVGGRTIGVIHVGSAEPSHFTEDDIPLLEMAAERAGVAVENWRLYQAEQQARVSWQAAARRLGRLGVVIAKLAARTTVTDIADTVISEALPFLGATGLWIYLLDPGGESLSAVAVRGYPEDLAERLRVLPMTADRPSVRSVQLGAPVFVASADELISLFPDFSEVASKIRAGAAAALPLAAGDRPFGSLVLQWDTPRRFDDEERSFLSALADQVAEAIQRARLYEAERLARALAEAAEYRTRVLQNVTSGMSAALTTKEATTALIDRGLRAAGAEACVLYLRSPDGRSLEMAGQDGYGPEVIERFRRIPLDRETPVTEAVRSGRPVLIRDSREGQATFPDFEPLTPADRSSAAFPLAGADRPIGAIGLTFAEVRTFEPEDVALMTALADQASIALERARLHDLERRERKRATFLDAVGEILARSLSYERTLAKVARLAVRGVDVEDEHIDGLADWCAIDLVLPNGAIRLAALEHHDSARVRAARERRARHPIRPDLGVGVAEVLRTGRPQLIPEVPLEGVDAVAGDGDLIRTVGEPRALSAIIVPLAARGRTLGVIEFLCEQQDRSYTEDDLRFAEQVAERASFAIDNARLYRDRAEIARTLQRALRPPDPPAISGVEIATRYLAAGEGVEVGGDFFELWGSREEGLWVTIGDVAGKGPGAVDLNLLARHTIRTAAMRGDTPASVLRTLNRALVRRELDERFCTAIACRIDLAADPARATVACGGHPLPILLRAGGGTERAGTPGTLLGIMDDVRLPERRVTLGIGDTLVMYSDGVVEERRGANQFGLDGLMRELEATRHGSPEDIAQAVEAAVRAFRPGGELLDDVALVVLRMVVPPEPPDAG